MTDFKIGNLDHVGIVVKDMATSVAWYEKVLGLRKVQLEKWGAYPIFMLAGKTGIALFPFKPEDQPLSVDAIQIKIDHFAFSVTPENFSRARLKLEELNITYRFKNHHYFLSIYINDPDGHIVELTTLVVEEKEVY